MRYSADHKAETRRKILEAAAERFRAEGYDGLGVDGLAKAAGVTNGAFYGHFASKADAYREVVVAGLRDLREGIKRYRADYGADWVAPFADFYFGRPKLDYAENACALPAFGPEAVRAPEPTRAAFESELELVHAAVRDGLSGADRDSRAWEMLGLMLGGVTIARAVPHPDLSRSLAATFAARLTALGNSAA